MEIIPPQRQQRMGPARVAHQVRVLQVRLEQLDDGRMKVTTSAAQGWARVVANHAQLSSAITAAFTEAQVAAYARAHGQVYDMSEGQQARRRRPPGGGQDAGWGHGQRRPDTYTPADWEKLPGGDWRSPAGRTYRQGTPMVEKVLARRRAAGLPT